MRRFSRLLLDRRWQGSRLRSEAAGILITVGSLLGHHPQQIDPPTPEISEPIERGACSGAGAEQGEGERG